MKIGKLFIFSKFAAKNDLSIALSQSDGQSNVAATQAVIASSSSIVPRDSKNGLLPLHDPKELARLQNEKSPETLFPVDIVAIHGINGDAYDTWTDEKTKYFWLRDSLPKEFPGARVFTYGYPADVLFSLEQGDFDSWARGLLVDLKIERNKKELKRRPIIFICHSMGGIVVKKAFNIITTDQGDYGDIGESSVGIIFLSTPHGGSDVANVASILTAIFGLPLVGRLMPVRNDSLKALERGSRDLVDIARNFRHWTDILKMYSFIEKKKISGMSERIVDDDSGSLNVKMETPLGMDGCDHRTICRYQSDKTTAYRRVLGALQDLVERASKSQ